MTPAKNGLVILYHNNPSYLRVVPATLQNQELHRVKVLPSGVWREIRRVGTSRMRKTYAVGTANRSGMDLSGRLVGVFDPTNTDHLNSILNIMRERARASYNPATD
ncbi:hypothetical protein A3A70_00330 [candidate division WWE3 bacterium RIFCSPLOWO2_01_FULL_42_11]|uniref:Uncharacterized protein n=1 Tax=candidate division WWE3 bacterium RIFCSPLOWO2_01_FULL_42_11 TaxID=1802627 RepID=A0A1F4VP16_UNCKA|nr:MAG: hypothetical protein A3A70_00330 [candidate division WWE3 bacterium RIFCSPLOWO2_01_FULL_42_11]